MHDLERANVDQRFKFAIQRVKVRRRMLTPEHLNDDAKKLANGRHRWSGAQVFKNQVLNVVGHRLASSPDQV